MSNCCSHGGGCGCVVIGGAGVKVQGAGTPFSPYVITIDNEYLSSIGSGVSHDVDGAPYYDPDTPDFVVFYDTDAIPYYDSGLGGVGILQDTDTIPYLVA